MSDAEVNALVALSEGIKDYLIEQLRGEIRSESWDGVSKEVILFVRFANLRATVKVKLVE